MDLHQAYKITEELLEDDEEEEVLFGLLFLAGPPEIGNKRGRGGSLPGRAPNKERDWIGRHNRLLQQYFAPDPIFDEITFRRRYRMSRRLFDRIGLEVLNHDSYFAQKRNAAGKVGISSLLKITAALRVLAYSMSFDAIDENLAMSAPTVSACIDHFCDAIIAVFAGEFLRPPNAEEMKRLLHQNALRDFPGMIGSIDCMHWVWKNCPITLAGQHKGKEKKPTKILEVVADYDLRVWHYNFGSPGSLNDINVLEQSRIFDSMLRGDSLEVLYSINGNMYDMPYFLADGIYPEWCVFVKSIEKPLGNKRKLFAKYQEANRKDVERCFGVLQARWRILDIPCRLLSPIKIEKVMKTCIILHNMIVEDERKLQDGDTFNYLFEEQNQPDGVPTINVTRPPPLQSSPTIETLIVKTSKLRNKFIHNRLQDDLVEHLWTMHGESQD